MSEQQLPAKSSPSADHERSRVLFFLVSVVILLVLFFMCLLSALIAVVPAANRNHTYRSASGLPTELDSSGIK
jgi:hypothetical protein